MREGKENVIISNVEEHALAAPELSTVRGALLSGTCSMAFDIPDKRLANDIRVEGVRLGQLDVIRYEGRGRHVSERRRDHIRHDHADRFVICMPSVARCGLRHMGSEIQLSPGSLIFINTARPFQAHISGNSGLALFSTVCIGVPGPLLRQRLPEIDDLCGRTIDIKPGISHIAQSLFELSLSDGPFLHRDDSEMLGETLIDLLAKLALKATDGGGHMDDFSSFVSTLNRAKRFVEAHLSEPTLNTSMIASHCRVSTRYLHRVFAASSLTVASYVRELRLQRCRDSLRSAQLRKRTILEISSTWGFTDSSTFCRAYRNHFGVSPSQDQRRANLSRLS